MRNLISLVLTLSTLLVITTISVLYSEGWRIKNSIDIDNHSSTIMVKTGMLAVRSIPDGGQVYLDETAITATDDTIASLTPKKYKLRVEKEGFETWQKEITVYPELVTDITAVLVSRTPRLEPLTNTNVKAFDLSSSYNDIVYITTNQEDPGVWILPLAGSALNILRNSSQPLIVDTTQFTPSLGTNLVWSLDDKQLLVELNPKGYLLYDVGTNFTSQTAINTAPKQVADAEIIYKEWEDDWKETFLATQVEQIESTQQVPDIIKSNWENTKDKWSPDERKFVVEIPSQNNPTLTDLVIYNAEPTLPIDEQRLNYTLRDVDLTTTNYSWYSDSYHLILTTNVPGRPDNYSVSLIRIDGTNQTTVYTGYLASNKAHSTPSGDKIIVLTSLKEGNLPNLYGIALR
ncbi:MAG: hypothetical protein QG570_474 [Patescibacteria group bacterium]|nr:hypothetical protein [Patescibacteria group bacterium]